MKTVELFAGTASFSNVAKSLGHHTATSEIDPSFNPDRCENVLDVKDDEFAGVDILWASPPCEGFSVASIGHHWNHDNTPKTDGARLAMKLAKKAISIIEGSKPKIWFIENPRGKLRKLPFMEEFLKRMGGVRHTVTYCQYGDTRQKPTDIWTNATWWTPKPLCKPGAPCHVAAPRGSRTGTQGIKTYNDRSRIPAGIFEEIFEQVPIQRKEQ